MPPPIPWRKDRQRWGATDMELFAYSLLGSGRCFTLLLTCYPLRGVAACRAFSGTCRWWLFYLSALRGAAPPLLDG